MLSRKEELILTILQAHGPMFGNELVAKSDKQLSRGTVYVHLGTLENRDLIEGTKIDVPPPGIARRQYTIKPGGRRALIDAKPSATPVGKTA